MNDLFERPEYAEMREKLEKQLITKAINDVVRGEVKTAVDLKKTDAQISQLDNLERKAAKQDYYATKMGKINLKKNLPVAAPLLLGMSILTSALSIFMSCAGVSHTSTLSEVIQCAKTTHGLLVWMMLILQSSTLIYSILSYGFEEFYHKINKIANLGRFVVIGMSVYSNHLFIVDLVPEYDGIMGWLFAGLIDFFANLFSYSATCLKYRLYDNIFDVAGAKKGFFGMLFFNVSIKFRMNVMNKYFENYQKMQDFLMEQSEKNPAIKNCVNQGNTKVYTKSKSEKNEEEYQIAGQIFPPENIEVFEEKLNKIENGKKIAKDDFGCDQATWRIVREYWKSIGKVKCNNRYTYKVG